MPMTVTLADALANIAAALTISSGDVTGDGTGFDLDLVGGNNDNRNAGFVILRGASSSSGGDIELSTGSGFDQPGGDFQITLGSGSVVGKLIVLNLPTSDPGVADAVYVDGAPSAGVPKPLMISGG